MRYNFTQLFIFFSLLINAQNRDVTFTTGTGFNVVNNYIYSSALQADGKLLIAGEFSNFNGTSTNNFIRLNANGTIDTAFKTNLGTGFNYETGDVAVQSDGKIIVLIKNSSTNPTFNGTAIKKIIRLNSNGTLDNTFAYYRANLNFNPEKILIQPDGKIIVGGTDEIVRVNSNGTLDSTFSAGTTTYNGIPVIRCLAIDSNNKILIGGAFVTYNGQNIKRIIRLNTNGTIDSTFNIGTGFAHISSSIYDGVNSMVIQSDGKIVVGGEISSLNGIAVPKVVRLNSDGTIDNTFNFTETSFDKELNNIKLQSNGSMIITGRRNITGSNISIARIFSNGQNDNSLNISSSFFGYECNSMQIQSDGKFILLGDFYAFSSVTVNRIIRITNPILSTNDFEQNKISIYPNPATENIYLSNCTGTEYEIFDILGKSITKGKINENQISINSLSKGIYILKVKNEEKIFNQKFIKE